MADFLVPALEKIVTKTADAVTKATALGAGIAINSAVQIPGVISAASAMLTVPELLVRSTLTAAQRVAAASAGAGGGTFVGLLGSSTNATAGTISAQAVRELVAQGYSVVSFPVCICPNCPGLLVNTGKHIIAQGYKVVKTAQTVANAANTTTTAVVNGVDTTTAKFADTAEKASGNMKGGSDLVVRTEGAPEPPASVNIGLIIAIALALKNQIAAGLRTFQDMIVVGFVRGNTGRGTPYSNTEAIYKGGGFRQYAYDFLGFNRANYAVRNVTDNSYLPPYSSLLRPDSTPIGSLPQINNREVDPLLTVKERIRNEEQTIQGYFEFHQYYHNCFTRGWLSSEEPTDIELQQRAIGKMFQSWGEEPKLVQPMKVRFEQQDSVTASTGKLVLEEAFPLGNPPGKWIGLINFLAIDGNAIPVYNPTLQYEYFDSFRQELVEIRNPGEYNEESIYQQIPVRYLTSVSKASNYDDGAPHLPELDGQIKRWYFEPSVICNYDHIGVFEKGYRIRMRPENNQNARVSYIGRTVRWRLWKDSTTAIKDALSIAGALLSGVTVGWSGIIAGLANLFLPDLQYTVDKLTVIDKFCVTWYVPYVLHYGAWTTPSQFVLKPLFETPPMSNAAMTCVDVVPDTRATDIYLATTAGGIDFNGNYSKQIAYGYPSVYNLTVEKLVLSTISVGTVGGTTCNVSWTAMFSADSYVLDVSLQEDFLILVLRQQVNGLTYLITSLNANTKYYARVRGQEQDVRSAPSNVVTFTTKNFLPPVALPASQTQLAQFTANWTVIPEAERYTLDVSTDANFTVKLLEDFVVSAPALQSVVSGLTPSTLYYYRVRAENQGSTAKTAYSNVITVATLTLVLATPVALPATALERQSFTVNWQSVDNATDYLLDVALDNGFNNILAANVVVSGTSRPLGDLTAGTRYYYRVRARSGASVSPNSNTIAVKTLEPQVVNEPPPDLTIPVPTALDATQIGSNQFMANWIVNTTNVFTEVQVSTENTFTSLVFSSTAWANGKNKNDTKELQGLLTPSTRYYYRVRNGRTLNYTETSAWSNVMTLDTLPPPALPPTPPVAQPAISITGDGFNALWTTSMFVDSYLLDVAYDAAFTQIVVVDEIQPSYLGSRTFSRLQEGRTLYYRVRARNSLGAVSGYSNVITVALLQLPPALVVPVPIALPATWGANTMSFTANWSGSTFGYYLDVARDAGFTDLIINNFYTELTYYVVSGLPLYYNAPFPKYYYRVRSTSSLSVLSVNSNVIETSFIPAPLPPIPGAPVATAATNVGLTDFIANWMWISGKVYQFQLSNTSSFSTILKTENTPFSQNIVSGVATNTRYFYRVREVGNFAGSFFGAWSNIIDVYCGTAGGGIIPVALPATNITDISYRANWLPVTGVTAYVLIIANNLAMTNALETIYNSIDNPVPPLTATFRTLGANGATDYYYQVKGYFADGSLSVASNIIKVRTMNARPFATFWSSTTTTATFRIAAYTPSGIFDPSTPYTHISIDIGEDSNYYAFSWFVPTMVKNDFRLPYVSNPFDGVVPDLRPDTQYYVRYRGITPQGASTYSGWSSFRTLPEPPPTPIHLPHDSQTTSSFRASWQPVAGASYYQLDVARDQFFTNLVINSRTEYALSDSITGLTPDTRYWSRVRAVVGALTSPNSNVQFTETRLPAPANLLAANNATTGFMLTWNVVAGATQYRVDISTSPAFTVLIVSDGATTTPTFPAINLNPNTQYFARVRAVGQYSTSLNSSPAQTATLSLAAVIVPPSAPTLAVTTRTVNSVAVALSGTVPATDYSMDVATDAAFTLPVYTAMFVEAGTNTVVGLAPDTLYYFRARGFNGAQGAYSPVVSGRTKLAAPVLLLADTITLDSFNTKWQYAGTVVQSRLDVARDAAFTNFVLNDIIIPAPTQNRIVTGLLPDTTYYVRVRVENAAGTSANSNVRMETTDSDFEGSINVAII
jgi:hypothetical protein